VRPAQPLSSSGIGVPRGLLPHRVNPTAGAAAWPPRVGYALKPDRPLGSTGFQAGLRLPTACAQSPSGSDGIRDRHSPAAAGPTRRPCKSAGIGTNRRSGAWAQDTREDRRHGRGKPYGRKQIEFLDTTGSCAAWISRPRRRSCARPAGRCAGTRRCFRGVVAARFGDHVDLSSREVGGRGRMNGTTSDRGGRMYNRWLSSTNNLFSFGLKGFREVWEVHYETL